MKKLIILTIIFASKLSFACTDFTGTFRASENGNITRIQQVGCESLSFIDPSLSFNLPLDGNYHLRSTDQNSSIYFKVLINGDKLLINTKVEFHDSSSIGDNIATRTYTEASKDIGEEVIRKTSYVNKNGVVIKQEIFSLSKISN